LSLEANVKGVFVCVCAVSEAGQNQADLTIVRTSPVLHVIFTISRFATVQSASLFSIVTSTGKTLQNKGQSPEATVTVVATAEIQVAIVDSTLFFVT
jgi:hypothetical protein